MDHLVCLFTSLASRRLQILGRPILNSSQKLQQLPLSKILDFVTPLFLDPAPASVWFRYVFLVAMQFATNHLEG
jgi:hypothetical protein